MQIKKTDQNDIETLMQIRLEMLRIVNGLDATQMGHLLYKSLGFNDNGEGMTISI